MAEETLMIKALPEIAYRHHHCGEEEKPKKRKRNRRRRKRTQAKMDCVISDYGATTSNVSCILYSQDDYLKETFIVMNEKMALALQLYLSLNYDNNYWFSNEPEEEVNVPAPPERLWIPLHRIERDRPFATFTVMCYNVLCEKYASSSLYNYCPSWALSWDYRKKVIMDEIKRYNGDVITLQEVETEQFRSYFKPELESIGYHGIFSAKSRAKTMAEDDRKYVDGCAIFWKADKFELFKEHLIEFTQLAIAKADGSEHMLNRVMTRDNIALAAVLRIREGIYTNGQPSSQDNMTGSPFVVCTAHIHWDPEFCDVKLVQCMMLVQELSSIIEETADQHRIASERIPLLVCGDLNSLQDSGVYEFLTSGRISADHTDFKDFRGQKCLQKLSSSVLPHVYSHKLKLESAYDIGMLPFTNLTCDFKGVIDYIFASPVLYRLGVLGALDLGWFQEHKIVGCPYPNIPSDHIPLLVQYVIIPPSLQNQKTYSAPHLFNR